MRGYRNKDSADAGLLLRAGLGAARLFCVLLCLPCFSVASLALAAPSPEKTFDLTISRGAVSPGERVWRVNKDDVVRLRVTSDAPGEIHLHGYLLSAKLMPGSRAKLAFKAYATGRYRLEWHPAGEIKSGGHHAPPLATLEVGPQ